MGRIRSALAVSLGIATLSALPVSAQEEHPLEPPDTSSPRATLFSFIETMNQAYTFGLEQGRSRVNVAQRGAIIEKISRHLDTSEMPEHTRAQATAEAAACLKEVLDRVSIPPADEVPGGDAEELPQRWRLPHTDLTVTLVSEGPFRGQYLFSARTVSHAREYYDLIESYPYRGDGPQVSDGLYTWFTTEPGSAILDRIVNRLPSSFRTRWGDHTVWQWMGLLLTLTLGTGVMLLGYLMGRQRAGKFRESSRLRYVITLIYPIVVVLVPLAMKYTVRYTLVFSGSALHVMDFLLGLVLLFAIMGVVWAAGNRVAAVILSSPRIKPKGLDAQFIRLACRILTMVAVVLIFLEGGRRLGIPLSTLLAGAGIGGFAIAMAAQDSLKNILGSMMITLDKPYQVGDRIIAKGYDGIVSEIGLRSTKLNLLTGHAASIPNEEMAKTQIENVARRPYIRRVADLRIPLDTSRAKIERAVQIIENLLKNHEGMQEGFPPRVYFTEFGDRAFNIRIIYWYAPPKYWEFLRYSQELNFHILRAFEDENISFSLPARLVHTDMDGTAPAAPTA